MNPQYHDASTTLSARRIVALTVDGDRLVRTRRFRDPTYIGDPLNAVRIFSAKGADELVFLRIDRPALDGDALASLRDIASEAFMPIAYGGGVRSLADVESVIRLGFEKVVINTALHENPSLAREACSRFGSQAIVASIEVKRGLFGGTWVMTRCGKQRTRLQPDDWARRCEEAGCGELLLTSIDRDGSMQGLDLALVRSIARAVSIPVVAMGGAGSESDFAQARDAGASACAAGSMFVYHGARRAVLINYSSAGAPSELPIA